MDSLSSHSLACWIQAKWEEWAGRGRGCADFVASHLSNVAYCPLLSGMWSAIDLSSLRARGLIFLLLAN